MGEIIVFWVSWVCDKREWNLRGDVEGKGAASCIF